MAESDVAYYQRLWQKAYLIEIIERESEELIKSFAFSMPPESVRIEIPQRVNITKTFGGVFVDDYGVDNAQISISGTTGNSQLKEVYVSGSNDKMTGKAEAFHVLEEILQYRSKSPDYDKYEMRLFDLSSAAVSKTVSSTNMQTLAINGWIVILKDGEISRSKDKPLFYNYSLQFVAVSPLGVKKQLKKDARQNVRLAIQNPKLATEEDLVKEVDNIREKSFSLKKTLAGYNNVLKEIRKVEEKTNEIEAKSRKYYQTVRGYISRTMGAVNSVFEIAKFPYDMAKDLIGACRGLRSQVESIIPSVKESFQDLATKYGSITDMLKNLFDIEESSANIESMAKGEGVMPEVVIVPPGTPGAIPAYDADNPGAVSDSWILRVYGSAEVVATADTRLDKLAMQYYGSPDYADLIAIYNGIDSYSDIAVGQKIKIPYLSYADSLRENEVYEKNNPYGTDISLDENNDLNLGEFEDFATKSAMDNIMQAVNLRLSEYVGSRVRLRAYGIKVDGGGFDSYSVGVLITSIRDTLVQDPRIVSVSNFSARVNADKLELLFSVQLSRGDSASFTMKV